MNADQHPALSADPGDPPSLTLVLPAGLGTDQTLKGLAQAIGKARTDLAARAWRFRRLERDCAASGDQIRQALCRGQVRGAEHAAALIDEAVIEVFGLWDQYPIPAACLAGGGTPHPGLVGPQCPAQDHQRSSGDPRDAEEAAWIAAGARTHDPAALQLNGQVSAPAGQPPGQGNRQ
jgi:hypothetical protein